VNARPRQFWTSIRCGDPGGRTPIGGNLPAAYIVDAHEIDQTDSENDTNGDDHDRVTASMHASILPSGPSCACKARGAGKERPLIVLPTYLCAVVVAQLLVDGVADPSLECAST